MYYVCITACTQPSHEEHARIDQAFIGCWIDQENEDDAVEAAKAMILEDPWVIEKVESADLVTADDYEDDPENLAYYEQALVDKNVIVFNVCPRYTTYFVQYDVAQDEVDDAGQETGEKLNADATLWISNETVVSDEPSPEDIDMMSEGFWSEARIAVSYTHLTLPTTPYV